MMFAALAGAALSTCAPVPGAERLWSSPSTRYVMVGETHGTNETPELFADLVCAASEKRPVVVALEQATDQQSAVDTFLKSSGDAAARAVFLKSSIWSGPFKDGRSSEAMLKLFERLRKWKQSHRIEGVVAFQDYDPAVPFSHADEGTNRAMAAVLERTAAANPKALVLAYSGSVHASRDDASNFGVHSAAARLAASETVTVFVDGAGTAWFGVGDHYGVHSQMAATSVCKLGVREVALPAKGAGLPGFDAIGCVGKPFSASPPAVPIASK